MAAAGRAGAVYFYEHQNSEPYGEFSQFYPSPFEHDGRRYCWAEQWMMANKAILMGDKDTLEQVMAAKSPSDCKALGRIVKPWDREKWDEHKYDVVLQGTRLKVTQNDDVRRVLLSTGDRQLAEASPSDRIWGIGINVKDAEAGRAWRGENLLGTALMQVREEVKKE